MSLFSRKRLNYLQLHIPCIPLIRFLPYLCISNKLLISRLTTDRTIDTLHSCTIYNWLHKPDMLFQTDKIHHYSFDKQLKMCMFYNWQGKPNSMINRYLYHWNTLNCKLSIKCYLYKFGNLDDMLRIYPGTNSIHFRNLCILHDRSKPGIRLIGYIGHHAWKHI